MNSIVTLQRSFETFEKPGLVISYKTGMTSVIKGSLVGLNDRGYAGPLSRDYPQFIGVANDTVHADDAPAGMRTVNVTKCGSFVYYAFEVAEQLAVGCKAFALSEATISRVSSAASIAAVGVIVEIQNTSTGARGYRIRIDEAASAPRESTADVKHESPECNISDYKGALSFLVDQVGKASLTDDFGHDFHNNQAYIQAKALLEVDHA